jgi:hypothetical protein
MQSSQVKLISAICCIVAFMAAPARADVIDTLDVSTSGTLRLGGTMTIDLTPGELSSIDLKFPTLNDATDITAFNPFETDTFIYAQDSLSDPSTKVQLDLNTPFLVGLVGYTGGTISQWQVQDCATGVGCFDVGSGESGSVTLAATPLPATLPLSAGGLGFVGYLTRRKRWPEQKETDMKTMPRSSLLRLLLVTFITATPAFLISSVGHAAVVEYTTQGAFDAATTGLSTINLSQYTTGFDTYFGDPGSNTFNSFGKDKVASNEELFALDVLGNYGAPFLSSDTTDNRANAITITIPSKDAITAIGFTYGAYTEPPTSLTVSLDGGAPITLSTPTDTGTFIGFTDTSVITSLVLSGGGVPGGTVIDLVNLTQGTALTTTPLPAAFPLFVTGVIGLGFFGRRRKRQAQAVVAAAFGA